MVRLTVVPVMPLAPSDAMNAATLAISASVMSRRPWVLLASSCCHAGVGAQVDSERGLTVGSRRYEVVLPTRAEDARAEAGREVSALVFVGDRRHRDEDVVRQKGPHRVDIGGLPRADELRRNRVLGRRARSGRPLAVAGCRPSLLQVGTGPLEGAVHRIDRRFQHVGHLARLEAENVAEDENGELAMRQDLQSGYEG